MRDVPVELLSSELITGSGAARRKALVVPSCFSVPPFVATHPAVLRLPLAASVTPGMVAPEIVKAVTAIASIIIVARAQLVSAPTVVAVPLVVPSLSGPAWLLTPSQLLTPSRLIPFPIAPS